MYSSIADRIIILLCIFLLCPITGYSQIVINEIMPANLSSVQDEFDVDKQTCPVDDCDWWFEMMGEATWDGDYPDWIELYNTTDGPVDLAGYGLSDDPNKPGKWIFPSVVVLAHERLIVFATGKDIKYPKNGYYMHTNFKIDHDGETLTLTNKTGAVVDQYAMGAVPPDFSCGRLTDGAMNWVIFQQPTPGTPNGGIVYNGFTETITSSIQPGFYPAAVNVTLSSSPGTAQIRYTTDGSTPDAGSALYGAPVQITATTVLKARCYNGDAIKSKVMTATYFIHSKFSMPVVSLSTNPENFWDEKIGIYVHGNYPVYQDRVANYWQDWERPVTIEFFENDGNREFTIDAGTKILGWGSRSNARKSLSLFFRDKYGKSRLYYPVFDNLPFNSYKALVLRAAGGDWQSTLIRDVFASDLVRDKDLDYQTFRPAIVYINGEYWGIHNIREKFNEDYLDSHYDLDKDDVDIISRYWRTANPVVIEGTADAYLAMENYVSENDMNAGEAYNYAKSVIDLDNLIDYLTAEIYYANYDWPGNNIKCWKPRTPASRWRWFLYDIDYAMNSSPGESDYTYNSLDHATKADGSGWPNPPFTTLLIRELMESSEFRNAFVNRMADYMNTRFLPDTADALLQEFEDLYSPEMQEHIDRWGAYGLNSVSQWKNNIAEIKAFFDNRAEQVKSHILDFFGLTDWNNFTSNVSGKGKIRINSIIPGNYPWTGQYVTDIPVTLKALPEPGYEFSGWDGFQSVEYSPRIKVLISEAANVTAHFTKSSASPSIVINEVSYNPSNEVDAGDWIELYNPYAKAVDISGWKFTASDDKYEFIFPANTVITADNYLVVCSDISKFEDAFPTVNNFTGSFYYGLVSKNETIRLYNGQNLLIDEVSYTSSSPWPSQANGFGPTLSLIDFSTDNSLARNWGYSVGFGTPGQHQWNRNQHYRADK